MSDRFFDNVMPDFVKEKKIEAGGNSLLNLLAMPYSSLSQHLTWSALDLKETVVMENWGFCGQLLKDFTLYSGTLGAAFLLFRAYQRLVGRGVTFLCGRAGVCALGAAAAKVSGKEDMLSYYLAQFRQLVIYGLVCISTNTLAKKLSLSYIIRQVSQEIIKERRSMAYNGSSPLMFEWYGERYWGAAHGLAGIMHVLMFVQLKPDEAEDVKGTLRYMIKNQFPIGNYPASEEDRKRDILVHWCHGAPGIALTLVKAAEVLVIKSFLKRLQL